MKFLRYDWENSKFIETINKEVLILDSISACTIGYLISGKTQGFKLSHLYEGIQIKNILCSEKNISNTKIISFNHIFGGTKSYLKQSPVDKDRNPTFLKNNVNKQKIMLTSFKSSDKRQIQSILYSYCLYLYNYFKSKNVNLKRRTNLFDYSIRIKELNSILKIGYPLNIIDIDPTIEMNFSNGYFGKKVLNHFLA